MLKDGLHTPNNFFYAISDSSSTEIFGHLWVLVRERGSEKSLFIADIFVDEKFRGRNIGTETLNWCDKQARELGCASVSLHVFEHNTKAFKLYERMGFNSVSIQMRKMV
jgi:ribosomal protein S18 acetylase RimI-like enzyme